MIGNAGVDLCDFDTLEENQAAVNDWLVDFPDWSHRTGLVSGYTTRALGNLSYKSGVEAEVTARRDKLAHGIGIDRRCLFSPPLTHSNRLRDRDFLQRLNGFGTLPADVEVYVPPEDLAVVLDPEWQAGIDGVVLNAAGVFPLVITADCTAVGFYDRTTGALGLAHIGLIAAVNRLAVAMVQAMEMSFGARVSDIEVVIYPAIRACHYDLSQSGVWQRIGPAAREQYGLDNRHYASGFFDLPGFIVAQLGECGIPAGAIHDSGLCTVCCHDRFFSHVAAGSDKNKTREGRFGAVIGRREQSDA